MFFMQYLVAGMNNVDIAVVLHPSSELFANRRKYNTVVNAINQPHFSVVLFYMCFNIAYSWFYLPQGCPSLVKQLPHLFIINIVLHKFEDACINKFQLIH